MTVKGENVPWKIYFGIFIDNKKKMIRYWCCHCQLTIRKKIFFPPRWRWQKTPACNANIIIKIATIYFTWFPSTKKRIFNSSMVIIILHYFPEEFQRTSGKKCKWEKSSLIHQPIWRHLFMHHPSFLYNFRNISVGIWKS
jgi:hypothetical protein